MMVAGANAQRLDSERFVNLVKVRQRGARRALRRMLLVGKRWGSICVLSFDFDPGERSFQSASTETLRERYLGMAMRSQESLLSSKLAAAPRRTRVNGGAGSVRWSQARGLPVSLSPAHAVCPLWRLLRRDCRAPRPEAWCSAVDEGSWQHLRYRRSVRR